MTREEIKTNFKNKTKLSKPMLSALTAVKNMSTGKFVEVEFTVEDKNSC